MPNFYNYPLPMNIKLCYYNYSGGSWIQNNIFTLCTRWDEGNYDVTLELFSTSSARNALYNGVTPGAVRELYNILGTPKYIDTTYSSGNTLIITPTTSFGLYGLSGLRRERVIAVKNISDNIVYPCYYNIKIEGNFLKA